uniref:Putative reverse transcriptase n=1 Tax=Triatoma infestans TaxID=30076 RepID=A0A023EZK8_TRIIF
MEETTKVVLNKLVAKRGRVKASLTRIGQFIDKFNKEDGDFELLEVREFKLSEIWASFDSVQSEIEELVDVFEEIAVKQEIEREKFEELFYRIQSNLLKIKRENPKSNAQSHKLEPNYSRLGKSKLPKIDIKKFDGSYDNWVQFYETFKGLIHDEKELQPIEKFHYLISLLEGDAADIVNNIEISGKNYNIVWEELCSRYKNNKFTIETHISALFNAERITSQSAKALHQLHSLYNKHIKALTLLDQPTTFWGPLLVYLLTSKFDKITLRCWEEANPTKDYPTFEKLNRFLEERYLWLESYEAKTTQGNQVEILKNSKRQKKLNHTGNKPNKLCLFVGNSDSCFLCGKESHKLFNCETFIQMTIDERRNIVKSNNHCWNCLGLGHLVKECKSSNCKHCNGKHNTLICGIRSKVPPVEGSLKIQRDSSKGTTVHAVVTKSDFKDKNDTKHVETIKGSVNDIKYAGLARVTDCALIATAVVNIYDKQGKAHNCRFILDSGSELNFIEKVLAEQLALPFTKVNTAVVGVTGNKTDVSQSVVANISSLNSDFKTRLVFNVLPTINLATKRQINTKHWRIPFYINQRLADPEFLHSEQKVHGILGCEIFFSLLSGQHYYPLGKNNGLVLVNTCLGWVVSGNVPANPNSSENSCLLTRSVKIDKVKEDLICEELFIDTYKRNKEGRFVVQLPFRKQPSKIGDSLEGAKNRFLALERLFNNQSELKREYVDFMQEYLNLGHMERVPDDEMENRPRYYLPHHAVVKDSLTTRVRVVFDASFKSTNQMSLNDLLMTGPSIQNDLWSILIKLRLPKFVLTGDICKMYRQIEVTSLDMDMQRILWRSSAELPLEIFRLRTVTYGTNCAPYLALRCLRQVGLDLIPRDKQVADIIQSDFYMDDLMTGAESEIELSKIQSRLRKELHKAGFELRKWCSNSKTLMNNLSIENQSKHFVIDLSKEGSIKALGLSWDPQSDQFRLDVQSNDNGLVITKRAILSDLNKFWDPLGFLSPVLIKGKMFLQELWHHDLKWDEPLSSSLQLRWDCFRRSLGGLNSIYCPRRVCSNRNIKLHGFCDASTKAFGCCIYITSNGGHGENTVRLLCAKGRVCPKKMQTIPRLELCAALLLAQVIDKVIKIMKLEAKNCYLWSDSQVVLTWINGEPVQWKQYVANRVSQIHEVIFKRQWGYVSSAENPADLLTRGITPCKLKDSIIWWEGPAWLKKDFEEWPKWTPDWRKPEELEERRLVYSLGATQFEHDLFSRFSSWTKLVKVVGYIFRFYNKARHKGNQCGDLSVGEINEAKLIIIKRVQQQEFSTEIEQLKAKGEVNKNSKLASLSPYLDKHGIIRVGGRLVNADLPVQQIHPAVLPYKSYVTELIMTYLHLQHQHAGPQLLLSITRLEFWPLRGKDTSRSIVHNCMRCKRFNTRTIYPKMAVLPSHRVTPRRPFEVCGVDFCGPIYVKISRRTKQKAYIAIFVCFSVKALHLELVSDMTTAAFMAALRRFFSRRGMSSHIYSDNGTNFVGAERELKVLFQKNNTFESISNQLGMGKIQWHFIPPGAPHFGGLWEASVKSVKYHLRRVMGSAVLTFEEVNTLLNQIEACLNSRPLTPLSQNPNDYEPLTPAHFLIGGPLLIPPETDLTKNPISYLKRWDLLQRMKQFFWQRWSVEYLTNLQTRNKWKFQAAAIPVGTLVLLKEDNVPPLMWKTARISELHPGKDGTVRVATVTTSGGSTFKRPVTKLCPLLNLETNE